MRGLAGDLGLSLGDIVNDDLSLYPAMTAATDQARRAVAACGRQP